MVIRNNDGGFSDILDVGCMAADEAKGNRNESEEVTLVAQVKFVTPRKLVQYCTVQASTGNSICRGDGMHRDN
jgi:hypothetical protein